MTSRLVGFGCKPRAVSPDFACTSAQNRLIVSNRIGQTRGDSTPVFHHHDEITDGGKCSAIALTNSPAGMARGSNEKSIARDAKGRGLPVPSMEQRASKKTAVS